MELDDEARYDGRLPAWLTDAPTGATVPPPVETSPEVLPLAEVTWQNTERLFLRLAERSGTAEYAQQYGTPGQRQDGIDLYVRLAAFDAPSSSRRYLTLQSRRVKDLTPAKIRAAVDDFLAGTWAARSATFIYATTHSLKPTQLAEEILRQADRLDEAGITFIPWGLESVSECLRDLPHIVEEFFGPSWATLFCRHPPTARQQISTARLPETSKATADWSAQLLGVHPAAPSPGQRLPAPGFVLPAYVPRPHDTEIRRRLQRIADGSQFEFLVVRGSSCTGKTRTAYEAVRAVVPHWRLIHPKTAEAVVALVDAQTVSSQTVLWLDDAHHLFNEPAGESAAAALRHLLERPGPGLLIATMWPQHYDALVTPEPSGNDLHPQTRELLRPFSAIDVPNRFHGRPLEELNDLAQHDSALRAALETVSEPGAVAQTLAAGPDLLDRWEHARCPYGRAVLTAAIDARRLGMRTPLTKAFLHDAAPGYLTDHQRAAAPADWFERATQYCEQPIKGVASALQPVALPTGMGATPGVYTLADYLEQHAGEKQADQPLPTTFWEAAEHHVTDGADLTWLARHAWSRGLRKRAVLTCHKALILQAPFAAGWLVNFIRQLEAEAHAYSWIARRAPLTDSYAVSFLLDELKEAGHTDAIDIILRREPELQAAADNPYYVALLMNSFKALNRLQAVFELAERAARSVPLEHVGAVAYLLETLLEADAHQAVQTLLRRDPASSVRLKEHYDIYGAPDDDTYDAIILLELLGEAGAHQAADALAGRIAKLAPANNPWDVGRLLTALDQVKADRHIDTVIKRAVREVTVTDGVAVANFLTAMLNEGTMAGVDAFDALLDQDPVHHVRLDDARTAARLINTISIAEWHEEALEALLGRDPASSIELTEAMGVAMLLESLHAVGDRESASRLISRSPAAHVELTDADAAGVARLYRVFLALDAVDETETLLTRAPVDTVCADSLRKTVDLINLYDSLGRSEEGSRLVQRVASRMTDWEPLLDVYLEDLACDQMRKEFLRTLAVHVELHSPQTVTGLLRLIHKQDATGALTLLLARKPSECVTVHQASAAEELIDALAEAAGPAEAARLVATGMTDNVSFYGHHDVSGMSRALLRLGADEENARLARRALHAGSFNTYVQCMDRNASDYRYGIEADEQPSPPWSLRPSLWDELFPKDAQQAG
ncbi:hypothetical protein [Streptomyces sp. NPDC048111]|uniref:hypothetical protein n=2 Tax=unclassified Streptomyces TaxID=2593676 RepID=UPI00372153CA